MKKAAAILAAALAAFTILPVLADDDDDHHGRSRPHDDLHDALQRGDILPLPEILERIRPYTGDRILEIEFDYEDGIPVYEIYFIDSSGYRREIEVDASTGRILSDEKDD